MGELIRIGGTEIRFLRDKSRPAAASAWSVPNGLRASGRRSFGLTCEAFATKTSPRISSRIRLDHARGRDPADRPEFSGVGGAPKEQPPRKLSGTRTAEQASDALESGGRDFPGGPPKE